jgi:hypothetical protein
MKYLTIYLDYEMKDRITLTGKIEFEPEDKTKKHINQASWKKMAMVLIDGEICEYYAWFIKKRYNLPLNKPLRGAHISFINDSMKDLTNNGEKSEEEALNAWEATKNKWHGKKIEIVLDLNPRSDGRSWWLDIPNEERDGLQAIRSEIGLGRPFFGMHMSLGYANEKNIEHSEYLHNMMIKGFILN